MVEHSLCCAQITTNSPDGNRYRLEPCSEDGCGTPVNAGRCQTEEARLQCVRKAARTIQTVEDGPLALCAYHSGRHDAGGDLWVWLT